MKKTTILLATLVLASLLLFAATDEANAQYGYWGAVPTHPFAARFFASPYSIGQVPMPPYFALHPPVYYSRPVARNYGCSPYAHPGTRKAPDVCNSPDKIPGIIENPHVEPTSSEQDAVDGDKVKTAKVKTSWIINSYVTGAADDFIVSLVEVE